MDCPCKLWLEKVHKELMPPIDPALQNLFDKGNMVDAKAQELWPGGVVVKGFNFEGYENTLKAMESGAEIIYQPTIVADGLTCRADVLVRADDGWDLHEVKAKSSISKENYYDATFQSICFARAGIKLDKIFITYLNKEYIKDGEIDLEKLFIDEEVTGEVAKLTESVEEKILEAKAVFEWGTKLKPEHIKHCEHRKACEWTGYWAETLSQKERDELFADVEDDVVLPLHIDKKAIKKELEKLEYPLYFFDYETYSTPIPDFDGHWPWLQVPFQFSVYVLEYEGATPETHDFLMETFEDPIPSLLKAFAEVMGPTGTVISWHAIFEKSRNEEMAKLHPEYAEILQSVNERTYDLIEIFKQRMYLDPAFGGSSSLKAVMPVLCPDLSYDNLNIHEGGTASMSWPILTDPSLPKKKREQLYRDMIDYCRLDVYGMVRIVEELKKKVS
ncbi:DUF2779 domain-containing protein [Patescibacteria group bacterium]|nr:DUF2779 domain-containing protein [Patescibacteria group bacterium]MBU1705411.1 DUF2779 domain-containing protein [Patescibacteria group bacterium]